VVLDDLLRDGEADPGTGIGALDVQPLEDHEHLVGELRLDADAVVPALDLPLVAAPLRGQVHPRGHVRTPELDRIADQVADERGEQ
jgi:hypothetical protein